MTSYRWTAALPRFFRPQIANEELLMSPTEESNTRFKQPGAGQAKKPYNKPAFRYERVFETSALTCGKVQTTQSGCHQNRKTS
jgi:hypothetical protein